jgi:superfamily II DNA or RNA helicase
VKPYLSSADLAEVRKLVDPLTFARGREYARSGAVLTTQWQDGQAAVFGQVQGSDRRPYTVIARLQRSRDGALTSFHGSCTCPVNVDCKHAVALVLSALCSDQIGGPEEPTSRAGSAVRPAPEFAAWEQTLGELLAVAAERTSTADVGLQFEVYSPPPVQTSRRGPVAPPDRPRLVIQPVVRGRSGSWVRSGVSWSDFGYGYSRWERDRRRLRLLQEIVGLHAASGGAFYGRSGAPVFLDSISSRRIWDLLAEAQALQIPLVQSGRRDVSVPISRSPAELALDLSDSPAGLRLEPRVRVDGEEVAVESSVLIGEPAHGIGWWQTVDEPEPPTADRQLRLAPLSAPLAPALAGVVADGGAIIPRAEAEHFLRDYYPLLRRAVAVTSADGSVALPEPVRPTLQLTVRGREGHYADLTWEWTYEADDGGPETRTPLRPAPGQDLWRDDVAETEIVQRVVAAAGDLPELLEASPEGPRLAAERTLRGMATVRLLTEALPAFAELEDVRLAVSGVETVYREAEAAPVIAFRSEPSDGHDWFDLAVTVSVEGEEVPFQDLFVALAHDEPYLILPSGTYFGLARPEFDQLARLIAEARALTDAPRDTLRVSRFQADIWSELERIGVVDGQAADWQRTIRALTDDRRPVEAPPEAPAGLRATLRPYQREGFAWLLFLARHDLGGVLADDMGLGKTLQTLALICHARERDPEGPPFLVVAPTSVVCNWASECAKFAPDLRVVAVGETRLRRESTIAELAAAADVVLTSYTLFRLDYDDYAAVSWAGLVLDEAQAVKNHQSQTYQCAKKLPTRFKLAITGTPLENNLMELWSLLSISAPGLFPHPNRFEEYYRKPVEKGGDTALLAQLRRRIRPLMLRRTKSQVLADLPDKQEQVVELELNAKHKTIYQRHLQRERQKVLGLLGDLDKNRFEIFRSLTMLRQASLDAGLIDPKYASVPSTKLDALMGQLREVIDDGHRVLVYSQFTRFLQAARERLDAAGVEYCYLDGKTRRRGAVLERFKNGDAPVFLVSLKAGGAGLNLTEADYCVLLDPSWNPATEAQAVDRVHRIGQTKKVMVYRLVAKDTIEEKVMALKAKKAALFSNVIDGGGFESAALTAADIRGLLA